MYESDVRNQNARKRFEKIEVQSGRCGVKYLARLQFKYLETILFSSCMMDMMHLSIPGRN